MNTMYFHNGNIFGFRAAAIIITRTQYFILGDEFIQYTYNSSKTHQGGLHDLKKSAIVINHICDTFVKREEHTHCVLRRQKQYLKLVNCFRINETAFYFQTYSDTFQLKNIPLEVHGFNKIVPSLCFFEEANKSLFTRYLCISVIQREQERGINSRPNWPYTSDVLFRYEKPNWKQHQEFRKGWLLANVMFLLRMKNLKIKSITMSGANCQALIVCLICRCQMIEKIIWQILHELNGLQKRLRSDCKLLCTTIV